MLDYEDQTLEKALEQEFGEEFEYVETDIDTNLAVFEGVDSAEQYIATDDIDEVEKACYDHISNLIDDLGVDALCWDNIGGLENYVEEDWFDDALRETWDYYIGDIRDEDASSDEFENRLEEEMADYGVDNEEDFLEKLIDNDLTQYGNAISWYIDTYGKDDFSQAVKDNNLFDMDSIVEAVINADGYGVCLARYDSEEIDIDYEGSTVYAFRIE